MVNRLFSRVSFDSVLSVKQVPEERIYKNYVKFKFKTGYEKAREIIRWLFAIFPHNLV